jgi:hypothetical protein
MVTFRKLLLFTADAIWLVKAAIRQAENILTMGRREEGYWVWGRLGLVTKGVKSLAVSVMRGVRSFGYGYGSYRPKVSRHCQLSSHTRGFLSRL